MSKVTEELEHEHTPEAIQERLAAGPDFSYLRDWVYGGIDGGVTTFAIVSGVVGADLSARVIVILGIANLLADGFSMAAGNYSATSAEQDHVDHVRQIEKRHIRVDPAGEREEIRQIYGSKGFEGEELELVVEVVTADEKRWIDTMLQEEYGLPLEIRSPVRSALATFAAFVLAGSVPLLPWAFPLEDRFAWSVVMTMFVFFLIGSLRSRWAVAPWWKTGLQTWALGTAAASIAYLVGYMFR